MLNIAAADKHVSMVEQLIRTIKDRTKSQVQYLPYNRYPRNLIIGHLVFVVKALNSEIGTYKQLTKHTPNILVTCQL